MIFNGKVQTYSVATEELSLVIQRNLTEGLCLLLLVAVIKTMTKATTGRFFCPHSSDTPSRDKKAGTRRRALKQTSWSNVASWLDPRSLVHLLSSNTQNTCLGCHHPPWAEPSFVTHQLRKCSADLYRGQSGSGIFSIEVLSSLLRADIKTSQHRLGIVSKIIHPLGQQLPILHCEMN